MCRWFAYISPTEPCLLEDVLIAPKHSLVKQVSDHYLPQLLPHDDDHDNPAEQEIRARNCINNIDGVGIAWYTNANSEFERGDSGESCDGVCREGPRPAVYKMSNPPLNDHNFRAICANTETKTLFAHIRAAVGSPTQLFNNHPFVFGRHAFMHNGAVSDFIAIKRALCHKISDAAFAHIQGSSDSEHVAALYISHLTKHGDATCFEKEYTSIEMGRALLTAIIEINDLQKEILGNKSHPNSLNICITDGIKLVACRFRNHKHQQPPSLYYSTKAGTTLNRKYPDNAEGRPQFGRRASKTVEQHGRHVIVASEPSTYVESDWELIGKNQYIRCDEEGVKLLDIPYKEEWNAEDTAPMF